MVTTIASGKVKPNQLKDRDVVTLVKAGNTDIYALLVKRHETSIYRVILRMTKDPFLTEDVVQDALIKALTKIHSFKEQSSFKSWVIKIAVNTAKNKLRKMRRENVELKEHHLGSVSHLEKNMAFDHLKESLQQLIDGLPGKQRKALKLRVFGDLSFKEVAALMNCPYDTAKANYRHALLKMKKKITPTGIYDDWEEVVI